LRKRKLPRNLRNALIHIRSQRKRKRKKRKNQIQTRKRMIKLNYRRLNI